MATDNANPYSKSGNLSLLVDLYPSRLNGPNFSITGGNTNGDLDFAWSPYNAQLDAPFQKYQIYGNGGPGTAFTLLDSISDRSITSVSLSGLNYPAEFYINQVTGSCSAVSNNSDTISSTVILSQIELSNHSIVIYPQPAEDFIILESGSKSLQLNQAKLYDIRGNLLQQFDFNSLAKQEKIMLDQAAGMYILDLGTAEGPVRKRIIIK